MEEDKDVAANNNNYKKGNLTMRHNSCKSSSSSAGCKEMYILLPAIVHTWAAIYPTTLTRHRRDDDSAEGYPRKELAKNVSSHQEKSSEFLSANKRRRHAHASGFWGRPTDWESAGGWRMHTRMSQSTIMSISLKIHSFL